MAGAIGALAICLRFGYKLMNLLIKAEKREKMNQIANIRTANIPAATAVVGYDLLTGERDARVPFGRKLDTLIYTGSAVLGDSRIEIFVQGQSVGKYANTSLGLVATDKKDMIPLDLDVPANSLLEAKVITAATTNPVVLQLEFSKPDYSGRRTSFRRKSGGARRTGARTGGGFF